jgi:hypothetical protein
MTVNLKLLAAQIVGMFVIFALALFLAAGTVLWLQGGPSWCCSLSSRSDQFSDNHVLNRHDPHAPKISGRKPPPMTTERKDWGLERANQCSQPDIWR